ncbi:Kelch repeat type 2, partial [Corchorus capsularis]
MEEASEAKRQKTENMEEASEANQEKTENIEEASEAKWQKTENMEEASEANREKTENTEEASEAKRQKTENMEDASEAKWQKSENMGSYPLHLGTRQELEATSTQKQIEGDAGTIQLTPVRKGKIDNMDVFRRNCPSFLRPFAPELEITSTQKYLEQAGGIIRFSPVCRGYILLCLLFIDEEFETAQWYTIQFCVGKDNSEHPLGNIKEISNPFMHLKALPIATQICSVFDIKGNPCCFFPKKVSLISDKGPLTYIPPTLSRRVNPQSGVLGGKIFLMGGSYLHNTEEKWGEFFDLNTMQWKDMPSPPVIRDDDYLFTAPIDEEKKILVGASGQTEILSFNVDEESWELYDIIDNNAQRPITGENVVSCGVLYWLDDSHSIRVVVFEPFIRINDCGTPYLDVILKGQEDYELKLGPNVAMDLQQ